ncbi:hypothetical protein EQ500_04915, partial [Lactobacillus sp. XV13L]|nr:hypothetical protein [Lactobacillus sp. XV13L]
MRNFFKRKIMKWLMIGGTVVGFAMLLIAGVSSIGGTVLSFLLSWQSQTCNQQSNESSGNLTVSGYSKNVLSKAVAVAEVVGADLNIKPALVFAQLAAETGMQDSREVREDNNFGGVKYSSSFSDIATPGNISPEGDPYAHFKSISGFATI